MLGHWLRVIQKCALASTTLLLSQGLGASWESLCACLVASVVSDSLRPHGPSPAGLLCPWDSPGKNTGVGCHFLLQRGSLTSAWKLKWTLKSTAGGRLTAFPITGQLVLSWRGICKSRSILPFYTNYLEISNVWWEDILFIEGFKLGRIIELDCYFAISNRITNLGNAYW